jgi:hypothetical protein
MSGVIPGGFCQDGDLLTGSIEQRRSDQPRQDDVDANWFVLQRHDARGQNPRRCFAINRSSILKSKFSKMKK